MQDLKCT